MAYLRAVLGICAWASVPAALLCLWPALHYAYGLSLLHRLPRPPERPRFAPPAPEKVWRRFRGQGPARISPLNPYLFRPFSQGVDKAEAGFELASYIAADRVGRVRCLREARAAGAARTALTVWLTRNWTIEAVLEEAARIMRRKRLDAQRRAPAQEEEPCGC